MKLNLPRSIFVLAFCAVFLILALCAYKSVYVYKFFYRDLSNSKILALATDLKSQAAIKTFRAQKRGRPFDIGIFGNSRSLMLSAENFDVIGDMSIFNFSVGGSSFVQSVKLIENLADEGLAPKTILVSLDHPQIQYTGYTVFPDPVFSAGDAFADFFRMIFADVGTVRRRLSDAFKVLDWAKDHVWKAFKDAWTADALSDRIKFAYGSLMGAEAKLPDKHANFRDDGSLVQELPEKSREFSKDDFGYGGLRGWDRHVYLGVKRLDAVTREYGVKIIVYESPIWPGLESSDRHTRKDAIDTHKWFVAGCANTNITCVNAAKLVSRNAEHWADCCHAPAADLGHYLSEIIKNN